MFTGIVEDLGSVVDNIACDSGAQLSIAANFEDLKPGESFSINGVCLSLLPDSQKGMLFDISSETLKLTTLGSFSCGDKINIERALQAKDRMGGHYVSGHVDTTAIISSMEAEGKFCALTINEFKMPAHQYIFPKGSITIDGVSLTINAAGTDSVQIMLIPHTLERTSLANRRVGDKVNIEFDYLARVIAHQVNSIVQLPSSID